MNTIAEVIESMLRCILDQMTDEQIDRLDNRGFTTFRAAVRLSGASEHLVKYAEEVDKLAIMYRTMNKE